MRRDPRVHLADVEEAGRLVLRFTHGLDLNTYRDDVLVRSAVERQLEIVGEALNRFYREDAGLAARIPEVRRVIGFRNVLAHGYDIVDHEAVWDAVTHELPGLVTAAAALLAELDAAHG
jgi:uncharacterized protein with HEPN domain